MKLKIIENPDEELRELAKQDLKHMKEKYGKSYCPCSLEHTEDDICMCKAFRDQTWEGECNCGRYMKVKVK